MKKTYFILFLGCFLFTLFSHAQSFSDLETKKGKNKFKDGWLKVAYRHTSLNGKYTNKFSGSTFDVAMRFDKYTPWALRYSFEYPVLGDLVFAVAQEVKNLNNGTNIEGLNQTISSGWLGWQKLAINAFTRDRIIISPGISFGDHIIASETWPPAGRKIVEPSGYYFFAGPYIMASYVINKKMWVDAYMNYDITFVKATNPPSYYDKDEFPNYPLPTLLFVGANVYTTLGFFTGIKVAKMKDTGALKNTGSRVDFTLGYNF